MRRIKKGEREKTPLIEATTFCLHRHEREKKSAAKKERKKSSGEEGKNQMAKFKKMVHKKNIGCHKRR